MAATTKNLGASGVLFTERRDFHVDPQVTKELWTDVAPFTTMVSNQEIRSVPDPVFKMFEHRNPWIKQEFQAHEDISSDSGVLPADNTLPDELQIKTMTGLPAVVDSSYIGLVCELWDSTKTSNKGVVVINNIGTTNDHIILKNLTGADLDINQNDYFCVIGNAQGEGSEAPDSWSDELSVVWNSTQIFKTALQVTGTLQAAVLKGESSELARLRRQKAQEHKMQKEKAFLFGKRVGGTGLDIADGTAPAADSFADGGRTDKDGNLIRTTYGIVSALEKYGSSTATHDYQNVFTASEASYSYGNFVDDMEKIFQYVPEAGVKRAFVGAGSLGYWSKMAGDSGLAGNSGWSVNLGDMKRDSLGFNYRVLETPHGMLQLIPTPALRNQYNKYMVVVSDENLFHAQYRPAMYQANIKSDNAFDGVKDQYMSDEGLGIQLIESHSLFKITA
tara:strand:- start:483 stop:1823 length:1341 start_codon:yes stop_codon:yes gene_type:complete